MGIFDEHNTLQNRRHFLQQTGMGIGATVMASLLPKILAAGENKINFAPKAKRVIFLFMAGGPSQLDLFDHKPELVKRFNEELPASIRKDQRVTEMTKNQARYPVAPSKFKFAQHGKGGQWFSELIPYTASMADDIAVINSMHTDSINHDPAKTFICTGSQIPGMPSLGAWLNYGLGSLNNNLPSFIVLPSARWSGRVNVQALCNRLWGTGFLPSKHQGVTFQTAGDPVLFLSDPKGVDRRARRKMLDMVAKLNDKHHKEIGDPEIQTTISQQEMAFRMQASVPELTNISGEPQHILDLYGPEVKRTGNFAHNCLLARRMVERGVRFVQLFHRGWDHHASLPSNLSGQCRDTDQSAAALIKDLKQRGLLDDTLVVWGGEFGRTVFSQGKLSKTNYGRDHHSKCFSIWMAGGDIKGGTSYGQSDEYSYNIVKDPVHVRDLNATILHQMGIDHQKLSVKFRGLDQRLTGVEEAHVMKKILGG